MMNKTEIQRFCRSYFEAMGAPVLREELDYLQVELPRHVDKELTDRPYYWMWVEATGQDVPDTVLHLAFDADFDLEDVETAELVAMGSFRLNRIFDSAIGHGTFAKVYEEGTTRLPLVPFLLVGLKVSYIAGQQRDEIVSYGVNLTTGEIANDLYEQVETKQMRDFPRADGDTPSILPPLAAMRLTWDDAWRRLQQAVRSDIERSDHDWAKSAEERLQQEVSQLETYYQSLTIESEEEQSIYAAERELRVAEVTWRCKPRIEVDPFHMAIVYLRTM